jgi:hypothetical protein
MRARIGKRVILDTAHAQLLIEGERHPWRAISKNAMRSGEMHRLRLAAGTLSRRPVQVLWPEST